MKKYPIVLAFLSIIFCCPVFGFFGDGSPSSLPDFPDEERMKSLQPQFNAAVESLNTLTVYQIPSALKGLIQSEYFMSAVKRDAAIPENFEKAVSKISENRSLASIDFLNAIVEIRETLESEYVSSRKVEGHRYLNSRIEIENAYARILKNIVHDSAELITLTNVQGHEQLWIKIGIRLYPIQFSFLTEQAAFALSTSKLLRNPVDLITFLLRTTIFNQSLLDHNSGIDRTFTLGKRLFPFEVANAVYPVLVWQIWNGAARHADLQFVADNLRGTKRLEMLKTLIESKQIFLFRSGAAISLFKSLYEDRNKSENEDFYKARKMLESLLWENRLELKARGIDWIWVPIYASKAKDLLGFNSKSQVASCISLF